MKKLCVVLLALTMGLIIFWRCQLKEPMSPPKSFQKASSPKLLSFDNSRNTANYATQRWEWQTLVDNQKFSRTKGAPNIYNIPLSGRRGADYVIIILNGEPDGTKRIKSGRISVGDEELVKPADFEDGNVAYIERWETFEEETTNLSIRLTGEPGTYLFLTLFALVQKPMDIVGDLKYQQYQLYRWPLIKNGNGDPPGFPPPGITPPVRYYICCSKIEIWIPKSEIEACIRGKLEIYTKCFQPATETDFTDVDYVDTLYSYTPGKTIYKADTSLNISKCEIWERDSVWLWHDPDDKVGEFNVTQEMLNPLLGGGPRWFEAKKGSRSTAHLYLYLDFK